MLCSYCWRAKSLLTEKGVEYNEIDVTMNPERRAEMTARANGRDSVPQIFVGDRHIGGCDDIHAAEDDGRLDDLLAGQ